MSSATSKQTRASQGTRERILQAAREVLRESGFAGATTRAVAERAGVQLSLVHYHFGGKAGLFSAVHEHESANLLERMHTLYAGPEPLSEKWRMACAYLDEDLESGYVRILWELWAAGLADEELATRWREAMRGWRDMLTSVVEEWSRELGVDLPASPAIVATLVATMFHGLEVELLAGVQEAEAPHRAALKAIGDLIERIERDRA
jgi:AcrR family transcriptional regulator